MACSSRGQVCLVHGIFYGLQGALGALSLLIILTDVDPRIAMYLHAQETNIIGDNPGLSIRPETDQRLGTPRTIISYKVTNRSSFDPWISSLDKFLDVYRRPGLVPHRGTNIYNCNYENIPPPGGVCDVDVKQFSACVAENLYGYHKSSPCVFLRLNIPYGWKPLFYNASSSLPDAMPSDLKEYVANLQRQYSPELNTVWISCEGENPADKEFIGPIAYYPRGLPGYYFIYDNVEGYLSPLVAVHFVRPSIGPLINIKCKAWARNIKHDNDSALGGVEFGLMME